MNPIFYGKVEHGKVIYDNYDLYAARIVSLEGKEFQSTLDKRVYNRSISQNSYYWGVIVSLIADHCGYSDKEDCHRDLAAKFASHPDDSGLPHIESTAKMTVKRFIEYTESIKRWAAEFLHVYIPDPNEFI